MKEHTITINDETFRLTYDMLTSANLLENQRPGQTIYQLLDSDRISDLTLLLIAGLDETHQKDAKQQLTNKALVNIARTITEHLDAERLKGTGVHAMFLPVKRAIGLSGIAGRVFTYDDNGSVVEVGKEASSVIAAS
jgi:hypothetical protein